MKCPYCSSEIDGTYQFCLKCGGRTPKDESFYELKISNKECDKPGKAKIKIFGFMVLMMILVFSVIGSLAGLNTIKYAYLVIGITIIALPNGNLMSLLADSKSTCPNCNSKLFFNYNEGDIISCKKCKTEVELRNSKLYELPKK